MSELRSIALLGGPESGKTTYLGALARALYDEDPTVRLKLSRLQADERAIQSLMDPLLEGTYPQRTKAERHRFRVALETLTEPEKVAFTLEAGDYDGEEVERLFKRAGAFSDEWRARAAASGVLLFLRHDALTPLPRDVRPPPPTEAQKWSAARGEPDAEGGATRKRRERQPRPCSDRASRCTSPPLPPRSHVTR